MLQAKALRRWSEIGARPGNGLSCINPMPQVLPYAAGPAPMGYRRLGLQWLRIDSAEALLREAHGRRAASLSRQFRLDPAPALALGLTTASYAQLLRLGGFRPIMPKALADKHFGPLAPLLWRWQPAQRPTESPQMPSDTGAFAALARLVA